MGTQMVFRDQGMNVPTGLKTADFILRPIVASDAELDYEAVMESKDFLREWSQSTWPADDFTVEANREDLATMEKRRADGAAFDYTIMTPDQTECLGCVYVFPPDVKWFSGADVTEVGADRWAECDAMVYFWVRKASVSDDLDRSVLDALLDWFEHEWGFENPVFVTTEPFQQQVAMFEATNLRCRFEIKLPDSVGRYLAYA